MSSNLALIYKIGEFFLWSIPLFERIKKPFRHSVCNLIATDFHSLINNIYEINISRNSTNIYKCMATLETIKFSYYLCEKSKKLSKKQYAYCVAQLAQIEKMFYGWKKHIELK